MKILWNIARWNYPPLQFDLKMKLTTLLLFTTLLGLQANNSYAQKTKITLDATNQTVASILDEIEATTEFRFVYNHQFVDVDRQVSLKVKRERIQSVLELLFANTDTQYQVKNKQVVLSAKTNTGPPKQQASTTQDPITVTGQVTNTDGVPLPGVSVVVKGTSRGVATDFDGNYQIVVPNSQSILVFTSIGYTEQEITVGNQTTINVTMEESVSQLDEVVLNAGYYKQEKKIATGNIAQVNSDIIETQPVNNPLEAIQGRMAGVYVTQNSGLPGGGLTIRIRGRNSLRNDGNDPLYIIDGVPFPSTPNTSSVITGGIIPNPNPLNAINPGDIESIEILKDADATAIYGSRGANGVVLITTKKGVSIDETRIQIDVQAGFSDVSNFVDLLNTPQYLEMRNEAFQNDGRVPTARDYDVNGTWSTDRYTDWQDVLLGGTMERYNYQASIFGGNEITRYNFSGGFLKQGTVFPGDFDYQRGSGLLSVEHTPKGGFSASFSVNYTSDRNILPSEVPTPIALQLAPNAPGLFNDDGSFNWENSTWINPLASLRNTIERRANTLVANSVLRYEIVKNLELKSNLGYTSFIQDEIGLNPISAQDPDSGNLQGSSFFNNRTITTWIAEPQISYKFNMPNTDFDFLVGSTFQSTKTEGRFVAASGFTNDELIKDLSSAGSTTNLSEFLQYNYNAFFGRINVNHKDRYILNLTGRRDGSSRFGADRRFGNFGAIGLAWVFTEESIIEKALPFISFGKLRGSYGTTGSDAIGDYGFLSTFSSTSTFQGVSGLQPERLANNEFGWETNRKLEAGLELGFLSNSILLNLGWFRNRSSNQLIGFPLPNITGFSSIIDNREATVQNSGLEVEISANPFSGTNFKWNTSLNVSFLDNELIEFPDIEKSVFANRLVVGESIFIIKRSELTGVDPETGSYSFVDVNGDGAISFPDDRQKIEEVTQEVFGGWNNSFSYKGLKLDVFLQFVKQNALGVASSFGMPGIFNNQPVTVLDRWQRPGDITNVQQFSRSGGPVFRSFNEFRASDGNVVDASFARIKNVSLSYSFPKNVSENLNINDLKLFVNAQNLFTFTNYQGLDPEFASVFILPPLRNITLGAQLTF